MKADLSKIRLTEPPVSPNPPTHSEDGVDLTLIRWMLSLTPAQRLDVLEDYQSTILRVRGEATRS